MSDDGTSPGTQCGAVHDIAGRCSRDMAHTGAHVARSTVPGHGSGGWLNARPGEPDTTYVDVRRSDENLRGVIGGALAKLGYVRPFEITAQAPHVHEWIDGWQKNEPSYRWTETQQWPDDIPMRACLVCGPENGKGWMAGSRLTG